LKCLRQKRLIAGVSVIEFKEILAGRRIIREVGSGSKGDMRHCIKI
jgi:hypothetical protein